MENSKLANTLKTLTQEEFEDFGKFITSPYHNRSDRNLAAFYNAIKPYYPHFKITKEDIYRKLYNDKRYSEKSVKNIMSYTYSLLMDFLAVDKFMKNGFKKALETAGALRQKSLDKDFLKYTAKLREEFELEKDGPINYLNNFTLNAILMEFYGERSMYPEFLKTGTRMVEDLGAVFMTHCIDYITNKLVGIDHYNLDCKSDFMEDLLGFFDIAKFISVLEEKDNKYFSALGSLYYGAMSHLQASPEAFYKAKNIFINNFSKFSRGDSHHISRNIENASNLSGIRYLKEVTLQILELNKLMLENRFHKGSETDYFETGRFTSVMQAASRLQDADFMEWLVENFGDELIPADKDSVKNLTYARIAFLRGEFEKSLSYLSQINYMVPNHKINIKFLTLMNFYELNMPDPADAAVTALNQYNNTTDDASVFQVKYVKDFIANYKKLWKLRDMPDKIKAEDLLQNIEKTRYLSASSWFQAKVKELQS